ncbi:MAG TPA: alternative ribosome rescue aminoacyl-tRNA hydrolase ArfB [Micropepsaceae bacterium]|nr:alternative ribosome rescue aminoacyl-tRNA hydrolase ArfB [Micropepsaceae bacterium]
MTRIFVTPEIAIEESELVESFVLSTGPGGQNVNKLATAVQLRFDAAHSPGLSDAVRARLMRLAGSRLTKEGVLIVSAREFRSQERNREAARERLFDLIRHAAVEPKPRKRTRPPKAAKERRLETKSRRSKLKRNRGPVRED